MIKWSHDDHFISIIGFPTLARRHFYIESGPLTLNTDVISIGKEYLIALEVEQVNKRCKLFGWSPPPPPPPPPPPSPPHTPTLPPPTLPPQQPSLTATQTTHPLSRMWGHQTNFLRFVIFPGFLFYRFIEALVIYRISCSIWRVSPQLSCGDTWQRWIWFKAPNLNFR